MPASNYLSATETVDLVASGKLDVEQVIQDHRTRYEERDKAVLAWVSTIYDKEYQPMKDQIKHSEALRGVMIGVKDIMSELDQYTSVTRSADRVDTADLPTQEGSPIYKDSEPGVDSAVVGICRAAGATILGKTVSSSFYITPYFISKFPVIGTHDID
jgi:Asp-tRNA(Asn)/Glu-tRNA(Gln) amidotransferase A subunit family amidase